MACWPGPLARAGPWAAGWRGRRGAARAGLVVAAERGVQDRGQQRPLRAEQPVQGRQRYVRRLGDRLDGGRRVAVLGEQALGGVDHLPVGGPCLGLAAGIVIAPLDSLSHIADSTTLMERV